MKGRESERKWETSSLCCFTPHMPARARSVSGPQQESRSSSESPTNVAGTLVLWLSSAAWLWAGLLCFPRSQQGAGCKTGVAKSPSITSKRRCGFPNVASCASPLQPRLHLTLQENTHIHMLEYDRNGFLNIKTTHDASWSWWGERSAMRIGLPCNNNDNNVDNIYCHLKWSLVRKQPYFVSYMCLKIILFVIVFYIYKCNFSFFVTLEDNAVSSIWFVRADAIRIFTLTCKFFTEKLC